MKRACMIALVGVVIAGWLRAGATNAQDGVVVSILSAKPEYLLGEPVVITYRAENRTDRAVAVSRDLRILVSQDGKGFFEYNANATGDIYATGPSLPLHLNPRQKTEGRFHLLYSSVPLFEDEPALLHLALPRSGVYFLRIMLGTMSSNTLKIGIVEPVGVDADVWKKLRNKSYLRFLQMPQLGADRQVINALTSLVRDFPDSTYTPYLALALGKHYRQRRYTLPGSRRFDDPQVVELRQQEIHYYKLASEMKQGPASLREEAMRHLAAELNHPFDGTIPEAVEVARRALREFPDGTHRDWFERFIEKHTRPKWVDPMDIVGKELEAMGYDPEMADVSEAKIAEMTEYVHREPHRLRQEGKLTYEQMRAEQARRLKEWTLKNMQPSRPSR
jgi:hypothetical protein